MTNTGRDVSGVIEEHAFEPADRGEHGVSGLQPLDLLSHLFDRSDLLVAGDVRERQRVARAPRRVAADALAADVGTLRAVTDPGPADPQDHLFRPGLGRLDLAILDLARA